MKKIVKFVFIALMSSFMVCGNSLAVEGDGTLASPRLIAPIGDIYLYNQPQANCNNSCSAVAAGIAMRYYEDAGWDNIYVSEANTENFLKNELGLPMNLICGFGVQDTSLIPAAMEAVADSRQYGDGTTFASAYLDLVPNDNSFEIIKMYVENSRPLIIATGSDGINFGSYELNGATDWTATSSVSAKHTIVVLGYAESGSYKRIIAASGWDDPERLWIDFDFSGFPGNAVRIIAAFPVQPGTYDNGWHDESFSGNGIISTTSLPQSQPFLDAYTLAGGETTLGLLYDNGSTSFVHQWPDAPATEFVYVQDFLHTDENDNETWTQLVLNEDEDKVYILTGDFLTYWRNNFSTLGVPIGNAFYVLDTSGNVVYAQKFINSNDVVTYIGIEEGTSQIDTYTDSEISHDLYPPLNITATALSDTQVRVEWQKVEAAEAYYILRKLVAPGETFHYITGTYDTFFVDSNLQPETEYEYDIRSVEGSNFSGPSTFVAVTTQEDPAPPLVSTPVIPSQYQTLASIDFNYSGVMASAYGYGEYNNNATALPLSGGYWPIDINNYYSAAACTETTTGLPISSLVVEFRAKVENGTNPLTSGAVIVVDQRNSNNHVVYLQPLDWDPNTYQDGQFFTYRAVFATAVNSTGMFKQMLIGLTQGSIGAGEKWTFDWIDMKTAEADFVDGHAYWNECADITTTSYTNGDRVMNPTGSRPSLVSPVLSPPHSVLTKAGLKFLVENAQIETARVFFKTVSDEVYYTEVSVDHTDGLMKTTIFDIPQSAIGQIKTVIVEFFDNASYQGKTIKVDSVALLAEDGATQPYPVKTVSEY